MWWPALLLLLPPLAAEAKRRAVAGVATFTGYDGVTGSIRFDGTCQKGFTMVTMNLAGLQNRFGDWGVHQGLALTPGCAGVGPAAFVLASANKSPPVLVPYGSLSDRLGTLSPANIVPQRVFLDDLLDLTNPKMPIVGLVLALYDVRTGVPRVCVPIVGEKRPRRPRPRPSRWG